MDSLNGDGGGEASVLEMLAGLDERVLVGPIFDCRVEPKVFPAKETVGPSDVVLVVCHAERELTRNYIWKRGRGSWNGVKHNN